MLGHKVLRLACGRNMFLAATLLGRIGGDSVYRKKVAAN